MHGGRERSDFEPVSDPFKTGAATGGRLLVMEQRVDFITLGVPDLDQARRFYLDGLGWKPTFEVPGEIVFLQVGHGLTLGLFGAGDLERDVAGTPAGTPVPPSAPAGRAPVTFSHNVQSEAEVTAVMDRAAAAGATILKPPQRADFGGFRGYFADPAGFRWEVAYNSGWHVEPDGRVTIGPVQAEPEG